MSSAEARFQEAFDRLKDGIPRIVKAGEPVSQNNVAREAGRDPSALKKARFPRLVREIKALVELGLSDVPVVADVQKISREKNRELKEQLSDAKKQRDVCYSTLLSAQNRIVELVQENEFLRGAMSRGK